MNDIKYDEIIALLKEVGSQIIQRRERADFIVHKKEDDSPVSNVDIWANQLIIERMKTLFPDDFIIGEESEDKDYPIGAERVWYIDPIDGTQSYVQGKDHFFILIGLVQNGLPDIGFCYKPIEKILIYTFENHIKVLKDEQELTIPSLIWNENGSLVMKHFSKEQRDSINEQFGQQKSPYIEEMVSTLAPLFGKTNGYLGLRRTYYWDLVAPVAIMQKAGFQHTFFDYSGKPSTLNLGEIKCRAYFSLPKDAPNELINWFSDEVKKLTESGY